METIEDKNRIIKFQKEFEKREWRKLSFKRIRLIRDKMSELRKISFIKLDEIYELMEK